MQRIHNFNLLRESYIEEIRSDVKIYEHAKTKAKLVLIPNEETNKVFMVQFATLPQNDNGVAHIIEHSVLCGSEKYPLKEPFVTLMKSSLQTFLNAMTFPDMTVYPVASQNHQDFANLMDIYLDAVFHPLIGSDQLIFRQEGWHFEEDGEMPYFNGVVFNEMKGAMANPIQNLYAKANRLLYDNIYGNNSGGDPQSIVDLSYEDFVAFHRQWYHPSNAVFYLYGDFDAERSVAQIEESIDSFEYRYIDSDIPVTDVKAEPQYLEDVYPGQDDNTVAMVSLVSEPVANLADRFAYKVVLDALFNLESSPIKRRIQQSGLAGDLFAGSNYQSCDKNLNNYVILVSVQDMTASELESQLIEIYQSELASMSEERITELFSAALGIFEFSLREAGEDNMPEGLNIFFNLASEIESEQPFNRLRYEAYLAELKQQLQNGGLLTKAKQIFNEQRRATIVLRPDAEQEEKDNQFFHELAIKRFSELSQEEQERERQLNQALLERQTAPDKPELLPSLELTDIDERNRAWREAEDTVLKCSDTRLLFYDIFTKDICYMTAAYHLSEDFSENDIFGLAIISEVLSMLDTSDRDYADLRNKMALALGGFSTELSFRHTDVGIKSCFLLHFKCLTEKLRDSLELVTEIVQKTLFTDLERLYDLLGRILTNLQMSLMSKGTNFATLFAASNCDLAEKGNELAGGLSFLEQLGTLVMQFETEGERFSQYLTELWQRVQAQQIEYVGLICDSKQRGVCEEHLVDLLQSLQPGCQGKGDLKLSLNEANIGYAIPSPVNYSAQVSNWQHSLPGQPYTGSMRVLASMLGSDYLWNTIRVRGGAYGAACRIDRYGNIRLNSYRDPNVRTTFDAFAHVADYLHNLQLSDRELSNYIIGTIGKFDHPLSPADEGTTMINLKLSDISVETLQRQRQEALHTKQADLKKLAVLFELPATDVFRASVGALKKLQEVEDKLEIVNLPPSEDVDFQADLA